MNHQDLLNDIQTDDGLVKHAALVRAIVAAFVDYGNGRDCFNRAVDFRCPEDCEDAIAHNEIVRDALDQLWDKHLSEWHSSGNQSERW